MHSEQKIYVPSRKGLRRIQQSRPRAQIVGPALDRGANNILLASSASCARLTGQRQTRGLAPILEPATSMAFAPTFDIDLANFARDPYPTLAHMRRTAPIAYVPQLAATLLTRRDDIDINEKIVEVFSSVQPHGLMTRLMGQNMMRKDGAAHIRERKAIFPSISQSAVRDYWRACFQASTDSVLDRLPMQGAADLVQDIAKPIAGEALKAVTGLTNMSWQQLDAVSQGMIDGCANFAGDPDIERNCLESVTIIDHHVDAMLPDLAESDAPSLLASQLAAGLPLQQSKINIRLAISGGQNEPRDVIAGLTWALLDHPEQLARIKAGQSSWQDAFKEYGRWMAPVGMSPRRVIQPYSYKGVTFAPEDRVFLMFASGNHDEDCFDNPTRFDIQRKATKTVTFGAGPHFCAGAFIARCLVADIALPSIFARLKNLRLVGPVQIHGWAFRGPNRVPIAWG